MFLIMGTDAKIQQLGTVGVVCPKCGRSCSFSLCKCYSFLHLFFLPVFRWNVRYIATCPGCACLYDVDPEAGKAAEKGRLATLPASALTLSRDSGSVGACPRCGAVNPPGSAYCNQYGSRL